MSATDTVPTAPADAADHGEKHVHPDSYYFKIAGILAVITAAEVAISYIPAITDNTALFLALLFPMMIAKFSIVAGAFMHLKGDSPLFTRLFVGGIILAIIVYLIVLFAFDEFF